MNVHPYTMFHNHEFRYRTWEKLRKFQQNLKKCPSRLCINPPSTNPDACHQLCQCKRLTGRHEYFTRKSGRSVPVSF